MPSPDDLAHLAIDLIGDTTDALLDDASSDGRKLKRGYNLAQTAMQSSYYWRFNHARQEIATTTGESTSDQWSYQYQLPADCLQPRRINENDRIPWAKEADFLLTDYPAPLLLEYTRLITDPNVWPGSVQHAFVTLVASIYAGTFKHDYALVKELREIYYKVDLPEAKTQDARAASINQVRVPTLTSDVRQF